MRTHQVRTIKGIIQEGLTMVNPVVHVEIQGSNSKRLVDFCGGEFRWELNVDNPQNYALN